MTLQQAVRLGQGEAGRRLVHDDDARVERQRLGDLDHLALGDREVLDEVRRARSRRRGASAAARRACAGRPSSIMLRNPPRRGSRPMKTLAATSRLSNRFSSWWTKAMPAFVASLTVSAVCSTPSMTMTPEDGRDRRRPGSSSGSTCPAPFSPIRPDDLAAADGQAHAVQRA